jgi:hypothetical protein
MATWKKVLLAGTASINDLSDVTIASASDAQILVHDGTDFDNVSVSGDVTITNSGAVTIGNDKVTTAKILNLNVTTAKIAADAVTGAKIADDAIDSEHYTDGSIDTAHIADSNVTLAKIANIANSTVLGNASGGAAAPSALTIDTDISSVSGSDDTLASAKAIKAYVDDTVSNSGGGTVTGVDISGDNGAFTNQTSAVTIEFATGAGIISAVSDNIDGSGNPGVSHSIAAAQTAIQSVLNESLKMGRDADNVIDFATTDNAIIFRANGANQLKIDDGNLIPITDGDITLGSNATRFASAFFDSFTTRAGTVQGNLTLNNNGNINVAGTSTLTGNVTAGANLTVAGDLTVNGTTTTLDTTHLLVEDHIIEIATNASPSPDNGTEAGLEVQTSTTPSKRPRFEWTKDLGASNDGTYDGTGTAVGLTGWGLKNHQESNQALFPIAIMEMDGADATAPTGNSAGIGSFYFASSNIGAVDGTLYLRVR